MCYDDSRKRTIEEKIAGALAAYSARFSSSGNLVWVNIGVADDVEIAHVVIERRSTVPPDNIWVGKQTVVVAPSDS